MIEATLPPCPKCGGELVFTELNGQHLGVYCTGECEYTTVVGPEELGPLFLAAAQHYLAAKIAKQD